MSSQNIKFEVTKHTDSLYQNEKVGNVWNIWPKEFAPLDQSSNRLQTVQEPVNVYKPSLPEEVPMEIDEVNQWSDQQITGECYANITPKADWMLSKNLEETPMDVCDAENTGRSDTTKIMCDANRKQKLELSQRLYKYAMDILKYVDFLNRKANESDKAGH